MESDLNDSLFRQPRSIFVMRDSGHAMLDAGIAVSDVQLVDRAIKPAHGNIVIASVGSCLKKELPIALAGLLAAAL